MTDKKEYIGDGVYANFDGYQIELSTQRETGWETIYLEPIVWNNLVTYVEKMCKR